jgi:hypothetical protein
MYRKLTNILNNQRGSAILLVVFSIVFLMSMAALVVDLGNLFAVKIHLKKTANAAVLSGAQELLNSNTTVQSIVDDILKAHGEFDSLLDLNIAPQDVRIKLQRIVPLTFSKLIGISTVPVDAISTARIQQIGRARGAAPVGIDEAHQLEFGTVYKLKVDQTEVSSGNFGILALGGPGAQTYEENLLHGYDKELKIGDIIDTQTGNIAGKTRSSINERINACPNPPGDIDHKDCPRILLVPVYRPYNHNSNQLKQVEITGFAYFYIMEPMSNKDTSITGMFIKRIDTGYSDPDAVIRGAYSIKLVE